MSALDHYEAQADPTPRTMKRSGPFTTRLKTVAEAVAFCEESGLDPADVRLAHNYVLWESPETQEEVDRRIAAAKSALARHVDFIGTAHAEYVRRGLLRAPGTTS